MGLATNLSVPALGRLKALGFVQKVHTSSITLTDESPARQRWRSLFSYSDFTGTRARRWEKFYRLYYSSTHWSSAQGRPDAPWYEIRDGTDDLLIIFPVVHLRPVHR
jgi:hypothetical protein